ncbi:MAG: ABC transporter ATP-binding protein [Flavobacteriales bacterium]|nr:ABC transporter ATP-binding protein [Flavobacteriales bacterium]
MSETIISVENLSKQYRLGMVGSGTLREDLIGLWYKARGKEDPYLQLGETNDRSTKGSSDYVWAIKDVNFEVKQGEVLGIIGKNGAGKSTLLKLLSRVTAPTTGTIKAKGRIASLLEVGTGFHPELTGKENVYLNGAIMGMKKSEITRKMDEIIDFAGVERYIDTPVKRYSSGMYVRLAFAVAAHLEPEILIVDEVLAVGDAEFQKKAIGKMEDVSAGQGRTVLFVSHNMKAVSSMCTRTILMSKGTVAFNGNTDEAIDRYLGEESSGNDVHFNDVNPSENTSSILFNYAKITPPKNGVFKTTDKVPIEVSLSFTEPLAAFHVNMHVWTASEIHLFEVSTEAVPILKGDKKTFSFFIPEWTLNTNQYICKFNFVINRSKVVFSTSRILKFSIIEDVEENNLLWYGKKHGILNLKIGTTVS